MASTDESDYLRHLFEADQNAADTAARGGTSPISDSEFVPHSPWWLRREALIAALGTCALGLAFGSWVFLCVASEASPNW